MTQEQQIDERTRNMLLECRELITKELPALKECIKELRMQTVSSPKMDGMPHGSATGDAMANRLKRMEKYESDLTHTLRRLEGLQRAARDAAAALEMRRRIFYESYYICGEKASVARREAGISERSATRYIGEVAIKKETGE